MPTLANVKLVTKSGNKKTEFKTIKDYNGSRTPAKTPREKKSQERN